MDVESLLDLARFAAALERLPRSIISFKEGGGYRMAVLVGELDETLAFLTTTSEEVDQFLRYEVGASGEKAEFVEKRRDHSSNYIPMINLAERPDFLKCKKGLIPPLKPVKLSDLASLVKLAMYKLYYDECPIPLYLSREDDGLHLGAMTKITEGGEDVYYFHTRVDEVEGNFLKVNISDIRDIKFSKGIGEHGFLYMKIIRLRDRLGLV